MKRYTLFLCAAIAIVALFGARLSPAHAAPPANDSWHNPVVISSLPFTHNDTSIQEATSEVMVDPFLLCRTGNVSGGGGAHTVWFQHTTGATGEYFNLNTAGSTYNTVIGVFTGSPSEFKMVTGGCNDDGGTSLTSRLAGLYLEPDTTYTIVVAAFNTLLSPGTLNFSMAVAPRYTVTKTADTADGTCDADCSVREAITASNTTPGAVIIPAGTYTRTLTGSSEDNNNTGDFDIRNSMGIYGETRDTTILNAASSDRVMQFDPVNAANIGFTLIIKNLSLNSGAAGFSDGGGLRNSSVNDFVAMEQVRVSNNTTSLSGGGMLIASRAQLRSVNVLNNTASSNGGGISFGASGGGTETTVEISNSLINNNAQTGDFNSGGGIHSISRLVMNNVTVSGNNANGDGGGVYIGTVGADAGSLIMGNSTIVNNTADFDNDYTGSVEQGGGLRLVSPLAYNLGNNIIANNTDNGPLAGHDCGRSSGTISGVYNLVETPGTTCVFSGTGDVTGVDPMLEALANNGGLTNTHALMADSPAIDTGSPSGCIDYLSMMLYTDQRSFGRSVDGDGNLETDCDRGAYEYDATAVPSRAPGVLTATTVDSSTVQLNWLDVVTGEDGFTSEYSINGTAWTAGSSVNGGTTTMNVTGLMCNTTYYFRVYAFNGGGRTDASNFAFATTSGCATSTFTAIPHTQTFTPIPHTQTFTPVPLTETPTSVPPTATNTIEPPVETETVIPPTSTFTPEPETGVELLVNGSFEIDTVEPFKQPDNWNVVKKSQDKRKCNVDNRIVAFEGDCAYFFKGSLLEMTKMSQKVILANFTFNANDTLTFSVHYKTNAAAPRLKYKVVVRYSDTTLVGRVKGVINTASVADYTEEVKPAYKLENSDITLIKVQFMNRALSGKIFIDDASLILDKP